MSSGVLPVIRVLVVDDDEDDVFLTSEVLRDVDNVTFEVDSVRTYAEGLDAISDNSHDVYLLDYRLGVATGLDLLKEAVAAGFNGPMILLTGHGAHDVDLEAMRAGAADYLIKGELTPALLERAIRYAIQRKRVEADLAETRRRLAESPERERLHLARELHDGPLQDLIGIWFHMGVLSDDLQDAGAADQVESIQQSLQAVIQRLRIICGELRPPTLVPFGLSKAILSHAKVFREANPEITLRLDCEDDQDLLPERVRLALYRIYQTAVANVGQHSQATNLSVELSVTDRAVRLEISDDGVGFQVPSRWTDPARQGHFGLLGAKERAEAVGGRFEVTSKPNEGTTILVTVPLAATEEKGA